MREGLHVSRRALLSAATYGSGATALPVAVPGPSCWSTAHHAYVIARRRHEVFLRNVLGPACHSRAASDDPNDLPDRIFALEEHGNDLAELRHGALHDLLRLPAADLTALRIKLRLAYEEIFRFTDEERLLQAIVADSERLLGSRLKLPAGP